MFSFLNLFRGKRPAAKAVRRTLTLEPLHARDLPSAGVAGLMGGHRGGPPPAALVSSAVAGQTAGFGGRGGHGCGGMTAGGVTLSASLANAGATAKLSYAADSSTLGVVVRGAAANSTLDVTVAGTVVGTVTTNAQGNGHAAFTDITAAAGATVAVGDLSGTLAQTRFAASLTGSAGEAGTATYDVARDRLSVRVTGLTATTAYSVALNGTAVGTFTTNGSGAGKLSLSPTAATVAAGSTLTVTAAAGTATVLSGTFA